MPGPHQSAEPYDCYEVRLNAQVAAQMPKAVGANRINRLKKKPQNRGAAQDPLAVFNKLMEDMKIDT
jgi:hypothetical protein